MAEIRVQVAFHFTIDPAAQIIGDITYPAQVQRTMVVGEEIDVSKVSFDSVFSSEVFTFIDEKANTVVAEQLRTAKPVSAPKATSVKNVTESTPSSAGADTCGGDEVEEDGESVF